MDHAYDVQRQDWAFMHALLMSIKVDDIKTLVFSFMERTFTQTTSLENLSTASDSV